MSTSVIKLSKEKISQLTTYYQPHVLNKKIPYTLFTAKKKWRDDHRLHLGQSDVPRSGCRS